MLAQGTTGKIFFSQSHVFVNYRAQFSYFVIFKFEKKCYLLDSVSYLEYLCLNRQADNTSETWKSHLSNTLEDDGDLMMGVLS